MDPLETLRRLSHAIDECDWADAVSALNDYYQWRLKGGFEPTVRWESGLNAQGDCYADTCANTLADKLEESA